MRPCCIMVSSSNLMLMFLNTLVADAAHLYCATISFLDNKTIRSCPCPLAFFFFFCDFVAESSLSD